MSSCTGADWSEAFVRPRGSGWRAVDLLLYPPTDHPVHQTVDEGSTGVLIHPPLAEPRKLCRCPRLGRMESRIALPGRPVCVDYDDDS